MSRATYAEAFAAIAGRPLIQLPQVAGRSESEIFFDALALNGVDMRAGGEAEAMLEPFSAELARALQARHDELTSQ
ncbi:MAG: HAD family hydrolase, partial [Streptosporangiaceae bacterium]